MFIFMIIFLSSNSLAWESDPFTTRVALLRQPKAEVRKNLYLLNDQTNRMLELAINQANKNLNCNVDSKKDIPDLFTYIDNTLGGTLTGELEKWVESENENNSGISRPGLNGFDIYEGHPWDPQPNINIADHIIGPDKIGHFFSFGFSLFKEYIDNKSIDKTLLHNDSWEETYGVWGLLPSSIKSYADLATNIKGLQFHLNLLKGSKPHIKCSANTGHYYLSNPMNWADYIDDSMDEGINCNLYRSYKAPFTKEKEFQYLKDRDDIRERGKLVKKNLEKIYQESYSLSKNSDLELNNFCPIISKKCDNLLKINCAKYIISPECFISSSSSKNYECLPPKAGDYIYGHQYSDYKYERESTKVKTTSSAKEL